MKKTLFMKAKNKNLSKEISITSPSAFKASIRRLKKGGLTTTEKKALVLAQNRAAAQLKRKNLSAKERKQFSAIEKIRLPKITK